MPGKNAKPTPVAKRLKLHAKHMFALAQSDTTRAQIHHREGDFSPRFLPTSPDLSDSPRIGRAFLKKEVGLDSGNPRTDRRRSDFEPHRDLAEGISPSRGAGGFVTTLEATCILVD